MIIIVDLYSDGERTREKIWRWISATGLVCIDFNKIHYVIYIYKNENAKRMLVSDLTRTVPQHNRILIFFGSGLKSMYTSTWSYFG